MLAKMAAKFSARSPKVKNPGVPPAIARVRRAREARRCVGLGVARALVKMLKEDKEMPLK